MSDNTDQTVKMDRNIPFAELRSHFEKHVGIPSLVVAAVLLVGGVAMLAWFFDGKDYTNQRALQLLYGFTFLLGFVTIWSLVHTMLVAFAEKQVRLMNEVGVPDNNTPPKLIEELGNLSLERARALPDDEIARLERLSGILAGRAGPAGMRSLPAGDGVSVVLRGFYNAAMKLPDARFFLLAFLILLIIALGLDTNYDLPSISVDIGSVGTPVPTEAVAEPTTAPVVASPEVGLVAGAA